MKIPFILLGAVLGLALHPPAIAAKLVLPGAVQAGDELHILGVDSENDQNTRWVVWSESGKQTKSVKLLVTGKKLATTPRTIPDAYEPNVRQVEQWQMGSHPILALTYRLGAAAQQLELIGLNNRNQAVLIDEKMGEQIEWRINGNGELLLSVYTKPEGRLLPTCYRWQEKIAKLMMADCN